jgi:hypothetical protein
MTKKQSKNIILAILFVMLLIGFTVWIKTIREGAKNYKKSTDSLPAPRFKHSSASKINHSSDSLPAPRFKHSSASKINHSSDSLPASKF